MKKKKKKKKKLNTAENFVYVRKEGDRKEDKKEPIRYLQIRMKVVVSKHKVKMYHILFSNENYSS